MSSIVFRCDLRDRFGAARDQGSRPTCLAFAMSDAHAASRNPWTPLSCEYLFYKTKQREGTPADKGICLCAIREAMEHDGQPIEDAWPYMMLLPSDLTTWKPPTGVGEVFSRKSEIVGTTFDEAWAIVMGGIPAVIIMSISDAFYAPTLEGQVDSSEPIDDQRRHAVVAVAAGDKAGERFLLVRNSWGETWGLSGNAWVTEVYMACRILQISTLKEVA